jgi:hypothetical protein
MTLDVRIKAVFSAWNTQHPTQECSGALKRRFIQEQLAPAFEACGMNSWLQLASRFVQEQLASADKAKFNKFIKNHIHEYSKGVSHHPTKNQKDI